MRIVNGVSVFFVFAVLLVPITLAADDKSRLPKGPEELSITLEVNEALEEGPIICTVTLKNVCKETVEFWTTSSSRGVYLGLDTDWKPRKEPPIMAFVLIGNPGPYFYRLAPGETMSETACLQKNFLSIPAGKATVRFGWNLCKGQQDNRIQGDLDNLFKLESKQEILLKPATEKNLMSVLRNFEAEFAKVVALEENNPGAAAYIGGGWDQWVETIDGCRHREFVPLLIRAVDRVPFWLRNKIVGTIYESFATTDEGFAVLADYLSAPHPAVASDVFDFWERESREHQHSKQRQEELTKPLAKNLDKDKAIAEFSREITKLEEEAWQGSKRHLDTRLMKEQFGQLRAIKNVWVRTLLYAHFPEQCSDDWVELLFKDLKQLVKPPERLRELIAKLDDESYRVREQATKDLIELCRAFDWQLLEVPDDKLSFEAIERLKRVRSSIEKAKMPELWQNTIKYLSWHPDPHAKRMLDVLRRSEYRNSISTAAQEAFEEQQKRKKETERILSMPDVKVQDEKNKK